MNSDSTTPEPDKPTSGDPEPSPSAPARAIAAARQATAGAALALYDRVVRRPVAVSMVALAFVVFGLASLRDLPVNLMPELSYPSLTVRTEFPAAAPSDVEERVTKLIEDRIGNVPGLIRRTSSSRAEISDILLEFSWGTDMLDAVTRTTESIYRVRLDQRVSRPQILRYDPGQDPVIRLMLFRNSDRISLGELRDYADDVLKERIARADGVAAVRVSGGYETQIRIYPDEQKLALHGLTADSIRSAVRASSVDVSAGLIVVDGREALLRVVNVFDQISMLQSLEIQKPGGGTVRLRDVTKNIEAAPKDPDTVTRYASADTGQGSVEGVLLEVLKEGDANIINTAHAVWQMLYGDQWQSIREGGTYPNRAERNEILRQRALEGQDSDGQKIFGLLHSVRDDTGLSVLTDQAKFIEASNREVVNAVYFGGALAVAVIFLFLKSGWLTFLIFVSIPLSVIATFIPMRLSDLSLNLMSLGGLALGVGMLVDSSIVVLESIARCREEGDGPIQAAARGTSEVAGAIFASTMTTVAVFFPIAFVEGMAGQIFREQALTVVFSLLAALVVALLVVPAYAGLSSKPSGIKELAGQLSRVMNIARAAKWRGPIWQQVLLSPLLLLNSIVVLLLFVLAGLGAAIVLLFLGLTAIVFRIFVVIGRMLVMPVVMLWQAGWTAISEAYPAALRACLNRPAATVSVSLLLAVASFALASTLPTELVPSLNENEFYVDAAAPEGTRLQTTDALALAALEDALENPELTSRLNGVMTQVGGDSDTTGRQVGPNRVRFVLSFQAGKQPTLEEVKQLASDPVSAIPEFGLVEVSRPTLFTLADPVSIEVRGQDIQLLTGTAEAIADVVRQLKRNDGEPLLFDIRTSSERGRPQIPIRLDRLRLTQLGISPQLVAERVRLKLLGEEIADFEQDGEKINIFLNLAEEDRARVDQLKAIEIDRGIRLGELLDGDLIVEEGPAEILRAGNDRVVRVTAQPNAVALGLVRQRIDRALAPIVSEIGEARIVQGGQQEELERSIASLIFALLLAIFLVYVVMATQFESLVDPLIIMGSLPLAGAGVAAVLWLTGTPLSVVVMLGVIVLAGIVVNNAIILVDCANRFQIGGMSARDAIAEAGKVRLRPIAITTLTTVLGMLPLTGWLSAPFGWLATALPIPVISDLFQLLAGTGEGTEIRAPMAITVVVGLSTSAALTLLVIPTLWLLVHARRDNTARSTISPEPVVGPPPTK